MPTTAIVLPFLPAGMTLSVEISSPSDPDTVLETVACTGSGTTYIGDVIGSLAGQLAFALLNGGTFFGARLRTIEDTAGPFIIWDPLELYASDGRGENLVTITVTDGTDPITATPVLVRVVAAGVRAYKFTTAGVAKFALNDGDYDVVLIASGFETTVESLTVSGVTPETYAMTAQVITPPSSALTSTGTGILYDEGIVAEVGKPVTFQFISGPGNPGYFYDTKPITVESIAGGVVQYTKFRQGAKYRAYRGSPGASGPVSLFATRSSGANVEFDVPYSDNFLLPELSGLDAE